MVIVFTKIIICKNVMKIRITHIFITFFISLLLVNCSKPEEIVVEAAHKGAKTAVMQSIADFMDNIQAVESDSSYVLTNGLIVTEAQFKYLTHSTHMFIAEIDITKNLSIITTTPNNENIQKTIQTIPEQMKWAEEAGKDVLLGVNGDFFGLTSDKLRYFSMNIFVKDGIIIKDQYHSDYEGLFVVFKNGDSKIIHPADFENVKNEVQEAMGGYHSLVKDGKVNEEMVSDNLTMLFDPRTIIGLSENNKKCYLFVIDGRQEGYSSGMRLKDVGYMTKAAGCHNAINLDGGGSSTFVVKDKSGNFKVLNRPSDGYIRPVINGLIVVNK